IAFRHPNCFHALPICESNQISDGSILRDELLLNLRRSDDQVLTFELLTKWLGKDGDAIDRCDPLLIDGLKELFRAIFRFAPVFQQGRKLLIIKAQYLFNGSGNAASNVWERISSFR